MGFLGAKFWLLKPCLLLSMVKSSLKVSWTSFIPIPHRTELAYCPPCSQTHHQIDNRRGYAQLFFYLWNNIENNIFVPALCLQFYWQVLSSRAVYWKTSWWRSEKSAYYSTCCFAPYRIMAVASEDTQVLYQRAKVIIVIWLWYINPYLVIYLLATNVYGCHLIVTKITIQWPLMRISKLKCTKIMRLEQKFHCLLKVLVRSWPR